MKRIDLVRHSIQFASALTGVVLAALIWGRATPEEVQQRELAKQFAELPVTVQERIPLAWNDMKSQSQERQAEIMRIHNAVVADPVLAGKMSDFTKWWTSLKEFERSELRQLERDQMLKQISQQYVADSNRRSELTVEFNIWMFFGRFGSRFGERSRPGGQESNDDRTVPSLTLRTEQFATLMQKVVSDPELECNVTELADQLTDPEHRLLLNCLVIQDSVLKAEDLEERLGLLGAINQILLEDVPDDEWRRQYRMRLSRTAATERWYSVMTPQLLLRSLVLQLGHRLRGKIALDQETIISEFAAIEDDDERQELMVRNPTDAIRRIEQKVFVTQLVTDSPERQLIQKFLSTEDRINEFLRSPVLMQRLLPPGNFGGPGANSPGRQPGGPGRENPPPRNQNR